MKSHFLKVRVTSELFADLCHETRQRGCTISDLVRERIRMSEPTLELSSKLARLENRMEHLVSVIEGLAMGRVDCLSDGGIHDE